MSHSIIKRTATVAVAAGAAAMLALPAQAAPAPAAPAAAASDVTASDVTASDVTAPTQAADAPNVDLVATEPLPFQIPGVPLNGAQRLDGSPITVAGGSVSLAGDTVFSAQIYDLPGTFKGNATVHWLNLATFRGGEAPMPYKMAEPNDGPNKALALSPEQAVGAGPVIAVIDTDGTLVPSAGQSTPYVSTPTAGFFVAP